MNSHLVIGTSGHIDHGKTALIRHLTGIETDRLKDEKARGITIENGYAHLKLSDGSTVGFIDVPGHEKFIKTMISGAIGFDAVMLIIAADEGIKPQTVEHLHILEHLNINQGIIIITKVDLVSAERLEQVKKEINAFLKNTPFQKSNIINYSIYNDSAKDALIQEIQKLNDIRTLDKTISISRLYVDRVFSIKGFGTVTTGTMIEGQLTKGDTIIQYPSEKKHRIKGLQVYGENVEKAYYGQRVAINISAEIDEISRGDLLSSSENIAPTMIIDIQFKLDISSKPILHWQRLKLYHGTREILCRIVLADDSILPGEEKIVQLRLEEPIYCKAKDRVIIRSYSPMLTVGGGMIMNPYASKKSKFLFEMNDEVELLKTLNQFQPIFSLDQSIFEKTSLTFENGLKTVETLIKKTDIIKLNENCYLTFKLWEDIKKLCLLEIEKEHRLYPLRNGISKETLRSKLNDALKKNVPAISVTANDFSAIVTQLINQEEIKLIRDSIALNTYHLTYTDAQNKIINSILRTISDYHQPIVPISEVQKLNYDKNIIKELLYHLINYEILVKINDENIMGMEVYNKSRERLIRYFENNASISVAQYRDLLDISRKSTVLLLEHFDKIQLTKRNENTRTLFKK
ncbi:selenocysteine-specific translation elongation factor [Fusibacter bizertensis]